MTPEPLLTELEALYYLGAGLALLVAGCAAWARWLLR